MKVYFVTWPLSIKKAAAVKTNSVLISCQVPGWPGVHVSWYVRCYLGRQQLLVWKVMLIWLLFLITSSNLGHLDPSLDSSHRRKFKAVFETLNDQSFTVLLYCSINKLNDMKKSQTINMNILNAFCQKFQINNQIIVSINHKTMSNVNTRHLYHSSKVFNI